VGCGAKGDRHREVWARAEMREREREREMAEIQA